MVFVKTGTLKCARLGFRAVVCNPRRLRGRRGFTRQPENSKRGTFERPGASNTHQYSTRRPPEREEKNELCGGTGGKKARNFGPPPFGPPLFMGWPPTFYGLAPPPFETHTFLHPPTSTQNTQKKPEQINFKKPKQLTPKNQNLYMQLKP